MIRVLVTGANGFVGSALLDELCGDDRFVALGSVRSEGFAGPKDCAEIAVRNLEPDTDWRGVLSGVNALVHTAARVHVMNASEADSLALYRRVNVDSTVNLARQAADSGVRRFVFVSSIKVNGERTCANRPYSATDYPAPVDPYGISKLEAEIALRRVVENTAMELIIVRPPLVYGPGVKANFLTMMKWVYRGVPLPLAGTDNRRSLIALDNLVDVLIQCLVHPKAAGRVFLVSDAEDLSTTELIIRVGDALSRPARLFGAPHGLLRTFGRLAGKEEQIGRLMDSLQVDVTDTLNTLGWQPVISVTEALNQTADAFLESLK